MATIRTRILTTGSLRTKNTAPVSGKFHKIRIFLFTESTFSAIIKESMETNKVRDYYEY